MTADLTFYTRPMSRGRMVRWLLEEIGVPYDTVIVDYPDGANAPAYRAINATGKVPTLVHQGRTVWETPAICLYLAETFPAAGLGPTPATRGDFYRWMFFTSGPLEAAMIDRMLGAEAPPERQPMVGYGSYERLVDTLESELTGRAFVAGDRFSAADLYLASQIGWGMGVGMLPKRPAFEAYLAPHWARAAGVRARAIDDALLAKAGVPA